MAKGHGELRQSQLITMFGPGALLDLPQYSVIVGGLDDWNKGDEVHEPRLAGKVRQLLDMPTVRFFTPPVESDDPGAPPVGITVWQFPEWFITQDVEEGSKGRVRTRLLVHRRVVQKSNVFVDEDRRRRQVVPVRFVRGCPKGHVGDIDWRFFVHADVKGCNRQLRIEERGTSGDLSEVWVACACGRSRSMTDASMRELHALGHCDGKRPWLGGLCRRGVQGVQPAPRSLGEQCLVSPGHERDLAAGQKREALRGSHEGMGTAGSCGERRGTEVREKEAARKISARRIF